MNLFLPSDSRAVHFVGIGGAGMSALALIALRRGVTVTGSDLDVSGCDNLVALGAKVMQGHRAEYVGTARAVVASAAIPSHHPEIERAQALGIPVVMRKVALSELIGGATTVAVAGTHGKTTTTVMTTTALSAAGLNPTGVAGGRVAAWDGNAWLGGNDIFVVEADEYDQAFLALRPTIAVVNNVEADHLECYGSYQALEDAFVTFADRADSVLVGTQGEGADRVAHRLTSRVWRFGPEATDLRLDRIEQSPSGTQARATLPGGSEVMIRLQVPGLHNLRNAAAALGVVCLLGAPIGPALDALARFSGVGRRFDRLGEARGVTFVDDYAHHPTELAATLGAARQAFPGRRLVAVFQPHLFSRTALHGTAMGQALAAADLAIVTEIYPAREQPIPGVSGQSVADAATRAGARVIFEADRALLEARTMKELTQGDVLLTLGAGDITRLGRDILARTSVI